MLTLIYFVLTTHFDMLTLWDWILFRSVSCRKNGQILMRIRMLLASMKLQYLETYQKKYYDARHVCYAYMLGHERKDFRANDNGEPSGTAEKPILGQINSNELTDILIVVVRYFGGIKLGTSGLIVAYKAAAAEASAAASGF